MLRGNPSGSQLFMGSFDSATIYCDSFLWVANTFCPKGVRGGTSLIFWATRPAQNPVKSRRGAGPPGPVLTNLSYRSEVPPGSFWLGWRVCDHTCEEKNSTPAMPTMQYLGRFCISAPPLLLASIQIALCRGGYTQDPPKPSRSRLARPWSLVSAHRVVPEPSRMSGESRNHSFN